MKELIKDAFRCELEDEKEKKLWFICVIKGMLYRGKQAEAYIVSALFLKPNYFSWLRDVKRTSKAKIFTFLLSFRCPFPNINGQVRLYYLC